MYSGMVFNRERREGGLQRYWEKGFISKREENFD